jgi:hypothetical protein
MARPSVQRQIRRPDNEERRRLGEDNSSKNYWRVASPTWKREYGKPRRTRAFHASERFRQSAGIVVLNKDAPAVTTDVNIDLFAAPIFSIELIPDGEVRASALLNLRGLDIRKEAVERVAHDLRNVRHADFFLDFLDRTVVEDVDLVTFTVRTFADEFKNGMPVLEFNFNLFKLDSIRRCQCGGASLSPTCFGCWADAGAANATARVVMQAKRLIRFTSFVQRRDQVACMM